MSMRDDFIEGTRRAEGEYDQNTDLSRYLRNSRPSPARAWMTRDAFAQRMTAEAVEGRVRVFVPCREGVS